MPQLIPGPWLMMLVLSWTTLLFVIPPKVLAYKYPAKPDSQKSHTPTTPSWVLPWT
uniref:ATP synthase complex subunit 8 n=1 Tax=Carapus bermudensis TaxID=181393 RepID=Q8HMJ1_9TELE|nr:ATP synthase F0 subunit 8 [Carapus bermudensis]BAC23168.1 ATPase subunit 8 [Carapus bermudensis]